MTTNPPHRPHLRRWFEYHDGHRDGPLLTGEPGTYRVRDDRILFWVDATTNPGPDELQTVTETAFRTRFCQVTLVGPSPETRRVADALRSYWDATIPAVPKTPKPAKSPAARGARPRCGQLKRNGEPCRAYAGAGADEGERFCAQHGGSTAGRERAREELLGQAMRWVELNRKARTGDLTPAEHLEHLVAARSILIAQKQGRLR